MDDERWNNFAAGFAPTESLNSQQISQQGIDLKLDTLPSDIIRKIIKMGQEDIHNARQVNHSYCFIFIHFPIQLLLDFTSLEWHHSTVPTRNGSLLFYALFRISADHH